MTYPTQARLARLRDRMDATGTDLIALAPGAHLRWLMGFAPAGDERPCFLLVGRDSAGWLMPALNAGDARQHTDLPFWDWRDEDGPAQALDRALSAIAPHRRRIALDETMRADAAFLLSDTSANATRVFTADTIGALRMRKDADEIAILRANARIGDAAQRAVHAALRDGISERDLAEVASATFTAMGARPAFGIVGAGANGAFPHHHTGATVIRPGQPIVVDIGGTLDGYYSDITRMCVLDHAPDGYAQVHGVVDEAVQAAMAAARPGALARDIDAAARRVIADAGYGDFFPHRTGHGLGSEIHEPPYMTATSDTVLEEGMVFTIEPGIYLPGRFGIRLEEVALITATGMEILSTLSRDLHIG